MNWDKIELGDFSGPRDSGILESLRGIFKLIFSAFLLPFLFLPHSSAIFVLSNRKYLLNET